MITVSDNTATVVLREAVGQANVNGWLEGLGLTQTKLLNGPQKVELGLLPLQQRYGLGMTTPAEMGRLLEMIRDGEAASPAACDRMLRLLSHQYWDGAIAAEVPPFVQVAHKTGSIGGHRSDGVVVRVSVVAVRPASRRRSVSGSFHIMRLGTGRFLEW